MKVRATEKYEELNIQDAELKRIPKAGEEFEVSDERFEILSGKNKFKTAFVVKEEDNKNNEISKTTKKKPRKK